MAALPSSLNSLHLPILAHHRLSSPSSRSISDRSPIFCPSRFLGDRLLLLSATSTPTADAFRSSCLRMMGNLCVGKAHKWWEKGLEPNMKEITSAPHLVESLLTAGDKLVVVDFFSPGCGGCKALHPKICQLAEQNPGVLFLQVNYEEHKRMCYSLNVHVLPFFRFYRGAHGRLCSFSCTNATIKKFKDALAKHGTDRCSLGPAKGLEEAEHLALASNKDLSFTYTPSRVLPSSQEQVAEEASPANPKVPLPSVQNSTQSSEGKALVAAGR